MVDKGEGEVFQGKAEDMLSQNQWILSKKW
jgi:hypothetical protein